MKKKLAVMALAAATLSMMAMPVYADDLVTVGYAQVGHESDWRTANTQNYQDVFSTMTMLHSLKQFVHSLVKIWITS